MSNLPAPSSRCLVALNRRAAFSACFVVGVRNDEIARHAHSPETFPGRREAAAGRRSRPWWRNSRAWPPISTGKSPTKKSAPEFDPHHFAYPTYARAAGARRDNLKRSIDELGGQIEEAKAGLEEALTELAKYKSLEGPREGDGTRARGRRPGLSSPPPADCDPARRCSTPNRCSAIDGGGKDMSSNDHAAAASEAGDLAAHEIDLRCVRRAHRSRRRAAALHRSLSRSLGSRRPRLRRLGRPDRRVFAAAVGSVAGYGWRALTPIIFLLGLASIVLK